MRRWRQSPQANGEIPLSKAPTIIAIYAFFPLLSLIGAYLVAGLFGCEITSAHFSACIVLGVDIAEWLAIFAFAAWLLPATLVTGAAAFVIWLIVAAALRFRRKV